MIYISKAGDGIKIEKDGKTRVYSGFPWEYYIDENGLINLVSDTTSESVLMITSAYDNLTIDGVAPTSADEALDMLVEAFTPFAGIWLAVE